MDKVIAVREMEREFEFLLGKDGNILDESQSKNFIIIDANIISILSWRIYRHNW